MPAEIDQQFERLGLTRHSLADVDSDFTKLSCAPASTIGVREFGQQRQRAGGVAAFDHRFRHAVEQREVLHAARQLLASAFRGTCWLWPARRS